MAAAPQKKKESAFAALPPVTAAAAIVSAVMYPIDVVRALRMASASGTKQTTAQLLGAFYQAHGLVGFLKQGVVAELLRATFSRGIKFWLQPIVHQQLYDKPETKGTPVTRGLAGSLATFPEVWTIAPLENAKLALQLDREKRFKGTGDVIAHLIRTRGVVGLYIGYGGMQLRQCLWTGGFFFSLNIFSAQTEALFQKKAWYTDTIAGFGAGVFGTTLNCWTDVVRTGIQKKALEDSIKGLPKPTYNASYFIGGITGVFAEASNIFAARGLQGLYLGYAFKALHLGGSGALLAVLVPRFKSMWLDN